MVHKDSQTAFFGPDVTVFKSTVSFHFLSSQHLFSECCVRQRGGAGGGDRVTQSENQGARGTTCEQTGTTEVLNMYGRYITPLLVDLIYSLSLSRNYLLKEIICVN